METINIVPDPTTRDFDDVEQRDDWVEPSPTCWHFLSLCFKDVHPFLPEAARCVRLSLIKRAPWHPYDVGPQTMPGFPN